jgi:hypothetical protein
MNNCKSTDFKYLSSKANAEKRLFDKGAIDVYNKIINLEIFNDLASQFLEFVKKEFNLDPTSVISGRFGDSVIFNNDVFRKVDKVRGYDKINAENIRKQLAELDKPIQEVELVKKLQTKLQSLYPEIKLNITNNPVWEQGNNILNQEEYEKEITYRLKAVDILYSDKGTQLFEKGKKAGWSLEKTLTELQIPKEQKELILNLGKTDREEIITDLLANYSYAVEINTANEQSKYDYKLKEVDGKYFISYDNFKTQDEVDKNTYDSLEIPKTKVYSNLTVPGGTNYTENEIATPAITPSIKGHAEFATDQGIGWFRSDDKLASENLSDDLIISEEDGVFFTSYQREGSRLVEFVEGSSEQEVREKYSKLVGIKKEKHIVGDTSKLKTRRILEVQSDLFQKGRDKKELISNFDNYGYYSEFQYTFTSNYLEIEDYKKEGWEEDGFRNGAYYFKRKNKDAVRNPNIPQNNFLQLLNKDSNWVTFFVKSIIQDSAKKGYEKVLFPSGNTASKIEGHTTLEQFKKQKEDRLKEIDVDTFTILDENGNAEGREFNTEKEALDYINNSDNIDLRYIETKKFRKTEINQLKQELERVEREGFGALKPIFNFYENTVTNVLNKTYGKENVKQITDEYGNTWNEITINQARELQNVLLQKNEANRIIGQANIKAMTVLIDAVNQKQDTLPHEYAHHYIAWFRNTPLVQEAIKKWGSEEALVQSIGEQAVKQKGEAFDWWEKFTKFVMDLFNNLSTKDKQELTNILTDAFLQGVDLETGKIGISRERSLELARKTSGLFNQEVKPGVSELFESNPELANIGTQQQYAQYLDTIFPDSQVKDVFTLSTTFNLLKDPSKGIQSLISKYRAFKGFIVEPSNTGNLYPKNSMYKDYKVIINPKDGLIEENGREGYKIAVESRIHVLGSKQDIEGFKEFVGKEEKVEEPVESTKIEKYLETETSEDKEVAKVETKKEVESREKAISDIVTKLKDLLTRLGINLKEFEEIYVEQENINTLTKKLEDPNLTEKQRSDIQNQINALKAKGVDKRAIAFADILNKTIGVSVDGKMEDLSEEVLHFIVDIIEQKYPELYKELYDKVWSYDKYKQVKEDYKDRYETEEEFRKEAIAQVLNDYLLKPLESEPESEYQNQKTEKLWDKIVNSLKNLFTKTANVNVDPFKIAIENLLNSDFITSEDVQYLNKRGLFYSLRKQKSAEEIRDNFLKGDSELEIKEGKDKKPRYFKNGVEVVKRVSDIVKAYYDSVFRNSEKKDTALNEQKREEGVEIHSIFQYTFAKYVSPKGEVLSTPIAPNEELKKLTEKYPNIAAKIDDVVKEIIRVNPNSYFLAEVKVSNGTKIGGTLDLVIINKKDGRTSVYDWKSKRGVKYDPKLKSFASISQIPWWNVNGWRIQLSEYTKILKANGVANFGEIRMIPVLTFEKKVGNEYVIDRIEITSFDRALVDPKKRQLLPVIGEEEKSPYKTIGKITEKIRAVINQNIQRIKADYKLKPDLEEENAALENMYTVLLATDNISSALGSLKVIIQDAKELANKAVLDKKKINDLSDSELYQYYKDIQSVKQKLSVYQEAEPDGTPIFTILGLADDIFGKKTTKIREDYEDKLNEFRQNPTQELDDELKKLKPSYDIAVSLIKIEAELKEVLPVLNEYSKDYFDAYATRNGVTDILGNDLGQSFLGKFMNNVRGLYSLNFKTAQLAKKVLMKANSIVRDKNKKVTDSMYALRDKFLKGESVFDIEDLFKNLIYYDKDKNDYFLVPEINKEFTKQFFEIKEKFEKGYNANGRLFFSTKEYQEIKEWMENNLEMDAWKKDFEEKKKAILSKFEQANKALKNSDPVDYASLLATKESQIEYFNNILTSPKALESLKKYKYVKRSKWESPEYKKLTVEEKEIHKKFTSIYARAESIGYVQGYQNYYRIPFKLRESKAFLQSLKPSQSFIATKEDDVYNSFTRIDPVTGEEIIEIPTHMTTYLPAIEKGKRVKSLDLFQVYLEFEQNLNRFEEMTKVEDLLLDLVRIEENKDKETEVNIFGNLTGEKSKKEKSNLLTITREDALKKLVYNALYKIKYERDVFIPFTKVNLKNVFKDRKYVSVKKTFQWLNDYSTALFIQASLKITGGAFIASSVVAGTATSKNIQGSKYFTSLLGRLNPKNINSSYRKAFNHSISQTEVEELNLRRTETLKRLALYGKEYLLNHLKHVDTFVQDAVFDASLEKWLVVDNKIVNAETYISSLIPNQDKMSYQEIKKKEAELYEKNKENTLAKYLEKNTKDKKTDISKLDKNSVYEFEQALRLESKKIVGNMSEEDMFAMRTGFFGAIFTKFKTWMPELFNTFFGGVYWREEGKRFEAGRFTSFYKSVMDAVDNTDASGDEKSMMKMGIEYVSNALMLLYNAGLFTAGRNKDAVIKRLETRYNLYVENLEELKVDKIPTKKEYIDLTLQEAENARNFMASVFVLYLFSNMLSVLSGDDEPEDHEYLVGAFDAIGLTLEPVDNEILLLLFQFANNFTGKGLKELQTYFSAESTYEAFAKLSFPALGALSILGKGAVEAGKTITPLADGEIKYTLDAIPVVRPALRTYIKYSDDEWLQEQLNVDKNYRLRKEEEEE